MNALDASLETIAIVFLLAAMIYSYKLLKLTKGAEIVALNKPSTVFALIFLALVALFLSPVVAMISDFIFPMMYSEPIQHILVILAGFFSVTAIYTAVYFYRTSPDRAQSSVQSKKV